jgi:amino acid transporter
MTQTATSLSSSGSSGEPQRLKRTVGFWGLMFVSLGSIIGSGWLLGALTAASYAGGASLISWILAAIMLIVLALIHADLGATYPVAGGTARYPHYAFGGFAGFTAGWVTYLQAVAIAPLEVEASLDYVNSLPAVGKNFSLVVTNIHAANVGTLTYRGVIIGVLAIILFAFINLMGAKWLSDSNTGIVIWKFAVPALTVIVLLFISFHPQNFTANGGFAPFGLHGIFAALPYGVVFALQGFEQASQMAGEARNPSKDVSKAIIAAMIVGALLYIALEVAFIAALDPQVLAKGGWAHPLGSGVGSYGPYYTIAIGSGAGILAIILIIDAVISPGGTGLIYIGTTARISYALGLPKALTRVSKRGVPIWSILLASFLGIIFFAPAPSWQQLVNLITGATAIMYAFGPIALGALRKNDTGRVHPYKLPIPKVLLPVGFAFANLIIYWGQFDATWKLSIGVLIGQIIFVIAALLHARSVNIAKARWKSALWIWPWLIGMIILGYLGNYGPDVRHILPEDWDALIIIAFSFVIYYFAVSQTASTAEIKEAVSLDLDEPDVNPSTEAVMTVPGGPGSGPVVH